jgi:hypothetical protein
MIEIGVITSLYGLLRNAVSDLRGLRKAAIAIDPRVARWRQAVEAHELDPFTALPFIGIVDTSVSTTSDTNLLASRVTPILLQHTAERFGVRIDWLLGFDDRIYESRYLESSLDALVDMLLEWQKSGESHRIVVLKSGARELEDCITQYGALLLERSFGGVGEQSVAVHQPISTAQCWVDDAQRLLALRAIWAAWHLGFDVQGYCATDSDCEAIAKGFVFLGPVVAKHCSNNWHPDDYIVRPSAHAKGSWWIEAVEEKYYEELDAVVQARGGTLRSWNSGHRLHQKTWHRDSKISRH